MRTLRMLAVMVLAATTLMVSAFVAPTPVRAAESQPVAKPRAVKAKSSKAFFQGCKKSGRFNERRFDFTTDAVMAGRCTTSRVKGVQLISTYSGHHPSANKALDIMVNLKGSCTAGRDTGNRVARYLMNNANKHGIRYLIWKNSYWAAGNGPTKLKNWRHGIAGGSCTTRHYDHVHAAFR